MRKVYKVTIRREYTQSYEILADDEEEALEQADEQFDRLELSGEELDWLDHSVELIQDSEDDEDTDEYDKWIEYKKYYEKEGEE